MMNHKSTNIFARFVIIFAFVFGVLRAGAEEAEIVVEATKAAAAFKASEAAFTAAVAETKAIVLAPAVNTLNVAAGPLATAANSAATKCKSSVGLAATMCIESSPKLANTFLVLNGLLTGAEMLGVNAVCSQYKKALDAAKLGLTAFTAGCALAKWNCKTDCEASSAATKALTAPAAGSSYAPYQETLATFNIEATGACVLSDKTAALAAISVLALVKRSMAAETCDQETKLDCMATPNDPKCAVAKTDCSKSENDTKTECICLKAPRTAGCGGSESSSNSVVMSSSQGSATTTPAATVDPNVSVNHDLNPRFSTATVGGGGSGGGGAPAAAPGGAGGRGADSNAKAGAAKAALNANILSGDSGGGGGGGGGYRGGSGGSSDPAAAYKAYLPGGEKDPSRGVASQSKIMDITGSGGEDNFSKVSNRYRDNRPSLRGE